MPNIIKLTPVYDRSRVVTDWKCPRARYWNYEHDLRGVVLNAQPLELSMGIAVHDALAVLAKSHLNNIQLDPDVLAKAAFDQMFSSLHDPSLPDDDFATEQATLVEGLIRGFIRLVWPRLLAQYPKILFTESEMIYEHDGLRFLSKPDLVLSNEDGSEIVYIEYKTTSSKKDAWINSWSTAIQLHSTVKAVEATHGTKIDAVVVQGLYKGYESYGKQGSPLCYAYKRNGHPPFSQDEIAYEYKAGFKRFPVWKLEGGVKKWVEDMPEVILGDQFPCTAPIYIKPEMVDRFFAQRKLREWEIHDMSNLIAHLGPDSEQGKHYLDGAFPQRFDQCIPGFGKPCSYNRLCHGPEVNPLDAGYVYREPHHDDELSFIEQRLASTE